jgi:hypothetical protein
MPGLSEPSLRRLHLLRFLLSMLDVTVWLIISGQMFPDLHLLPSGLDLALQSEILVNVVQLFVRYVDYVLNQDLLRTFEAILLFVCDFSKPLARFFCLLLV